MFYRYNFLYEIFMFFMIMTKKLNLKYDVLPISFLPTQFISLTFKMSNIQGD